MLVASGLDSPVHLLSPDGDPRIFVVEQPGRVRIIAGGRLLETPYLDITDRVRSGGERGLLSLAFHPRFAENGRLFVNYTDLRGDTRVSLFRADPAADTASAATEELVLALSQPYPNHNGGHVLFGPDGMLWVPTGDGGAAGDPHGNAQDRNSLLGKLLRLDVDAGAPYVIPADNPFPEGRAATLAHRPPRPEIWAWGLRNPWRIAFDTVSGLLYVSDVGQNAWEEINIVPAGRAGINYGWRGMEGDHCFLLPVCRRAGLERPVLEYGRSEGCSVIGGAVYRGRRIPRIAGHYFYSDWCSGWLRSFRYADGRVVERHRWRVRHPGMVLSFGVDSEGELYVLSGDGSVYRIEEGP